MIAYRLARRHRADLTGEIAALYGSRYNPRGVPAVYASESLALAALEVLVHLEKSEVPTDFVALGIEINRQQVHSLTPEAAREIKTLAADPSLPIEAFERKVYRRPVLRLPSVVIPRERNYVLFPAAPRFNARIVWVEPFRFDPRLFSQEPTA